ncbi:MAG: AAA family ATPase [Lachnospiraceae bacterium]|nr:AAA family ATPase [Lachnospiraceae bacterium]
MGIYLNPGNEGFKSAVRSQIYIDKTGLLEYTNSVLDTEQRYICVSRPRRFGKSIAAEMLVSYYDKSCNSKELFQGLKISENQDFEKHLNKYDVLHIDINHFQGQSISAMDTVENIQHFIIEELKENYPGVVNAVENKLPHVLAQINNIYGVKFIVIIDEWDAIFRENKTDEIAQKEYITLLRGLFKNAPSKKFLKLAYMTGILPIKKYGTESALNNFDEFTMLEPDMLAEFVGFTENEVISLYQEYGMDFEEAKRWYDGYYLNENLHIYNPKSVVDSIRRKKISNYWTSTETYESLKNYITMNFDGLKDAIIQMIAGGNCKIDTNTFENDMIHFQSKDDVLTVLVHLGYLAYNAEKQEVSIPNEEVRAAFVRAIKKSNWNYVLEAITASDELLKATWRRDEEAVAKGIDKVHMENTSILNYNNENALSCVISLAYYNAINEYTIVRELPTGKGYADVVFLPRKDSDKPAMVIELKWNRTAEGAIGQIKEKKYVQVLKKYKGNLLLVGINYDEKKKEHQCKIEEVKR